MKTAIIILACLLLNGCAVGYFSDGKHRVMYARIGDKTAMEAFEMKAGDSSMTVGKLDTERMTTTRAAMMVLRAWVPFL